MRGFKRDWLRVKSSRKIWLFRLYFHIVAGLGEDDEVIIILRWLEKIVIIIIIIIIRWLEKYFYSHSFHIGWAKVGVGGDELGG